MLTLLEPRRYISILKLKNATTRTRLKTKYTKYTVAYRACYTHFLAGYILISIATYNFRCLCKTLHNLQEQLLETSKLKTRLCHRLVIKNNSKLKLLGNKQPQYASLLNKVFVFSVTLLDLGKYFCKRETFLQYIIANMKV